MAARYTVGERRPVDPQQVYWYMRMVHGVSDAAAKGILANIQAESTFVPGAVGDGGHSIGLFQHHRTRAENLRSFAAQTGRRWDDWTAQVDFAMREAQSMGFNFQTNDAAAFASQWTIRFERPANATQKAAQRAAMVGRFVYDQNGWQQYGYSMSTSSGQMVGPGINNQPVTTNWASSAGGSVGSGAAAGAGGGAVTGGGGAQYGSGGTNITFAGGGTPGTTGGTASPVTPPQGYEVWEVDGVKYAVYTIHGGQDTTATVGYRAEAGLSGEVTRKVTLEQARDRGLIMGGTVEAFRGAPVNESYQDMFERILYEAGLYGSEALSDQGVLNIIAMYMARDMTDAELVNRLQQTDWYQGQSDLERTWNDKSDAQKNQEIVDHASQLISRIFSYVGEVVNIMDFDANGDGTVSADELKAGNSELYQAALDWASGARSEHQLVNEWLKPWAEKSENSPWARMVRDETLAQRQFDVDVENRAAEILGLYRRYGLNMTWENALGIASQVQWNEESMGQMMEDLDAQATALYSNKPRGIDTQTWAAPYLRTYAELMEVAEPDLFDNDIQAALTGGMNLGDFRQHLRSTDRWLETDNAAQEFYGATSSISRQFGFV